MSGPKKADWGEIKRLYITEKKSARELARQFALSNSTISDKVKKEDWDGQRLAYDSSISRRTYDRIADTVAHETAAIRSENILAARAYVRKFIGDLRDGNVQTNARDAVAFIQVLTRELAPERGEGPKTDAPGVIEVHGPQNTDLLRAILERARSRRVEPGGLDAPLLGNAPDTRPN